MATTNETRVKQIANAYLFSDLGTIDLAYWTGQLDKNIYTPTSLALLATQMPVFQDQNLPLATMYYCAFGTFPTMDKMKLWKGVLDTGASLSDVGTAFVNSTEFAVKYPTTTTSAKLNALISASGVSIAADAKAYGLAELTKGTMSWGDALHYLANVSGKQTTVGISLLNTAVSGVIPTATEVVALGSDTTTAINAIYTKFPVNTTSTFTGTTDNNIFYASTTGGSIRGLAGNDDIYCNTGKDKMIFEATPSTNGIDIIHDFQLGKDKDILDFSKFLNVVSTTYIATKSATSTAEVVWKNGAILVASGNALTTDANVAALFGALKAFAAPTEASKMVMITADIIGDASIWYIINQTDTAHITADEVYQVGTIEGINNLSLVGFDTTNLADSTILK